MRAGLAACLVISSIYGEAALAQATADRSFMVGRWTDSGDCADAVAFNRDGRFLTSEGTGGLWHLSGDRLTLTGNSTLLMRIVPIDRNTVRVTNADGSPGQSSRCTGGEIGAELPLDGSRLDEAYVEGRWTDSGDCADSATFRDDGSFVAGNGSRGRWTLQEARLKLISAETLTLEIIPVDRDTMLVVNPDGSLGRSMRCQP